MNEEIKTTILILISPVLISVLGFILKKMFAKFEESQKQIVDSINELREHIFTAKSEITLMSQVVNTLESQIINQDKLIQKEVDLRNKRLDRHSHLLVETAKELAVLQSKLAAFENGK